ncbi:hypothetical protein TSOC_000813 [Tetrabaena socialis]|uniref:Protein kinase domain-containing protein n=1 Tax=Tetrabaena socialis TaxID=47790 RepID=A0A2J8AIH5_9CHLO|nr:hypothetical protein TSOC_000813 [Tetrabaena socialis]|eukprot:PNH12319.1 hypothetical protein TSOC_000813 [Tetrabaena socialis]
MAKASSRPASQSLDANSDDPGRLVLREVLGKGGHGVVFRGTMHSLEVAIKVFQTPGEDEPLAAGTAARPEVLAETLLQRRRVLTRAALELAIMTSISHPNVCQVYAQWPTALLERDETQPCRRRLRKLPPDTPPPATGGLVCAVMVMEYCDKSSLDLSYETYAAIRHLPLARDVSQHARQQLVMRLDNHSERYPDLFQKVIDLITSEIMPLIHECGLAGRAEYASEHRMFVEHPRAAQMLIDVLTDRGYNVSHSTDVTHVPTQIDLQTGERAAAGPCCEPGPGGMVKNRKEYKHRFHINWDTKGVREMAKAMELAARISEAGAGANANARISQTYIPTHINRELRANVVRQTQQQLLDAMAGPGNGGNNDPAHVIHGS